MTFILPFSIGTYSIGKTNTSVVAFKATFSHGQDVNGSMIQLFRFIRVRVDLIELLLGNDRLMFCRIDEAVKAELADIDRVMENILDRRLAPGMAALCLYTEAVQFMRDPWRRKMPLRFPVEHHPDIRCLALIDYE